MPSAGMKDLHRRTPGRPTSRARASCSHSTARASAAAGAAQHRIPRVRGSAASPALPVAVPGAVRSLRGTLGRPPLPRRGAPKAQKKSLTLRSGSKAPATCYSPTGNSRSTLADEALHFRVRNGNGCYLLSMATGEKGVAIAVSGKRSETNPVSCFCNEVITASLWAISIGRLSALLRVHPQPIKVVVFNLPSPLSWGKSCLWGGLALRCFQRLSVPHIATRRVPLA